MFLLLKDFRKLATCTRGTARSHGTVTIISVCSDDCRYWWVLHIKPSLLPLKLSDNLQPQVKALYFQYDIEGWKRKDKENHPSILGVLKQCRHVAYWCVHLGKIFVTYTGHVTNSFLNYKSILRRAVKYKYTPYMRRSIHCVFSLVRWRQ